jgi:hypothetical protein
MIYDKNIESRIQFHINASHFCGLTFAE